MARILILGASGTLAAGLSHEFLEHGHEVFGISRSEREPQNAYTSILACDYSVGGLLDVISKVFPILIVNTVAEINLEECQKNISIAYQANVQIGINLVEAVSYLNKNIYLVQISSDNVYSDPGFSREDQVKCVNNYGYTKLIGELPFNKKNSLVLRTNYLTQTNSRNTYFDWVCYSLKNKKKVQLFNDLYFNATSIENIAQNICHCFDNKIAGTFNLGIDGSWSKADFYLTVAQLVSADIDIDIDYDLLACPQADVPRSIDMRMDTSKAKQNGFKILKPKELLETILSEKKYGI